MTKSELLVTFKTAAEIARFFGITDAAVGQWGDDEPIPELRELQLRLRRPDLFGAAPGGDTDPSGEADQAEAA